MTHLDLGRLNLRVIRVLAHFGKVSQLMVVWLFVADLKNRYGISFWWGLLVLPAMYAIHLIDKKWILAGEVDAVTKANPFFVQMNEKLDRVIKNTEKPDEP